MTATADVAALASWAATLDQLDWAADAAWMAIGRGDLEGAACAIDALDPPPMLPPLPQELGDRAEQILDRLQALEELLAAAQQEVRKDLSAARRRATGPRPGSRSVPCFIDRRS